MKKYIIKLMLPLAMVFIATSCGKSWLDVNTDPNNPKEATLGLLLPSAQVAWAFRMTRDMNKNTMVFTQQAYDLSESQYTQNATTYSNDFNGLMYDVLKDNEEIINLGTASEAWEFVGVAKIQKAYIYMIMVDLWGDLPFSEALQGEVSLTPKFDDDADVYSQLIGLIDEGIADLDKDSSVPLSGDIIYGNGVSKWKKAANTIKLRIYLNTRKVDAAASTAGINALISAGGLIDSNEDDFEFQFGTSLSPLNRHPLYQIEYAGSGNKDVYMSNYFMYNLLKRNDPRVLYYIYRQGTDDDLTFETTPCSSRSDCVYGLLSTTDLGDAGDGYIGRDHGDPSGLPGDDEIRATWGVYPIGGSYDDDARSERTQGDGGQGEGVITYMSNAMRAFMLAEAILTLPGVSAPKTAKEYMEEGMMASMEKVEDFSLSADENAEPMDEDQVQDYIDARLADFDDEATNELKLNVVIKEKYYAQFGNGMEVFTDLRRTGYPADLPRSLAPAAPFPLRLPYSVTELSGNPNAPSPPPSQDTPIFWDK
ncbi:SusD/RagB family nutrient-binding outer membrane lipoprotein [Flammeovirgaceae bacterium SG7u.111]|nr:SusD/RagB family nutrient-binding outer membrane lipoprotein [Flammeovirgaceae bacterium SG7u.132]WPO37446.1 SusD/RagB family nutrient-binding outer membrane lipoprotein [Flammeovirgaceae bacterium SG7u.111]